MDLSNSFSFIALIASEIVWDIHAFRSDCLASFFRLLTSDITLSNLDFCSFIRFFFQHSNSFNEVSNCVFWSSRKSENQSFILVSKPLFILIGINIETNATIIVSNAAKTPTHVIYVDNSEDMSSWYWRMLWYCEFSSCSISWRKWSFSLLRISICDSR